jgi:hypothetical protein
MKIDKWYPQPPWWVYALIVVAIFILASRYILPLYQAMQEFGGPDG